MEYSNVNSSYFSMFPISVAPPPPAPVQNAPNPAFAHQAPVAHNRAAGTRSVKPPSAKPGGGGPKPDSTLPMCEGCNRAIV